MFTKLCLLGYERNYLNLSWSWQVCVSFSAYFMSNFWLSLEFVHSLSPLFLWSSKWEPLSLLAGADSKAFCSPRTGFQACLRVLPLAVLSEALLWVSSIRSWWSWLKNLEHVVHKNHSAYCSDSHYFCYLFCAAICSLGVVSKITHHSYFLGSLWFLLRNFCQCWQWWFLNLQLHVLCGSLDKINQQS